MSFILNPDHPAFKAVVEDILATLRKDLVADNTIEIEVTDGLSPVRGALCVTRRRWCIDVEGKFDAATGRHSIVGEVKNDKA